MPSPWLWRQGPITGLMGKQALGLTLVRGGEMQASVARLGPGHGAEKHRPSLSCPHALCPDRLQPLPHSPTPSQTNLQGHKQLLRKKKKKREKPLKRVQLAGDSSRVRGALLGTSPKGQRFHFSYLSLTKGQRSSWAPHTCMYRNSHSCFSHMCPVALQSHTT